MFRSEPTPDRGLSSRRNNVIGCHKAQDTLLRLSDAFGVDVRKLVFHKDLILDADEAEDVGFEPNSIACADGVLVRLSNGAGYIFLDLFDEVVDYASLFLSFLLKQLS